jgi:F0F1-type ATP synthase assembly protein I
MSQLDPSTMSRRQQFAETYRLTKTADPKIGLILLAVFVVGAAIGFGIFWILPGSGLLAWVMSVIGALLLGLLATMIVFSRRAQKAAYTRMEGQRGAAAAALSMLRRGWKVEPAVAFTKQQDVVHRVVGPPGIVLVAEGNRNRVKGLLVSERRKHERVVSDDPVHEVICGNDEGEVPLPKLVRHVQKLGRKVKPAEQTDILNRLKALDAVGGKIPLPKGPVPHSMKGMRGNMRGR